MPGIVIPFFLSNLILGSTPTELPPTESTGEAASEANLGDAPAAAGTSSSQDEVRIELGEGEVASTPDGTPTGLSSPESKPEAASETDYDDAPPTDTSASQDDVRFELGEGEVASTTEVNVASEQEDAKKNLVLGFALLCLDSRTSLFKAASPSHRLYVSLTVLGIAFALYVWHAGTLMSTTIQQRFLRISTISLYGGLMSLVAVSLCGVF